MVVVVLVLLIVHVVYEEDGPQQGCLRVDISTLGKLNLEGIRITDGLHETATPNLVNVSNLRAKNTIGTSAGRMQVALF